MTHNILIDPNLAVITSRYVLENNFPILEVIHNTDGIWEFYSNNLFDAIDFRVVSLEEIVKLDSSISCILHIQEGYFAQRKNQSSEWIIQKIG